MTVEKFIRILGYIVYAALWSPVIILCMIVLPVAFMVMFRSVSEGWSVWRMALKAGIRHDMEFIKTGVWAQERDSSESLFFMPERTVVFRENNTSFYEKQERNFLHERRICMTLSTFAAGLLITVVAAALELMNKDYEKERDEFENS